MHIYLHVTSGPAVGRKIHLRAGQIARIGRTDWADFSFPDDSAMAEIHFAVKCESEGCSVRNLHAESEVLVNDQQIDEAQLKSGDQIAAGATVFEVHIDGMISGPVGQDAEEASADEPPPLDLVAICQYLELEPEACRLAKADQDPDELLGMMVEQQQYMAALRLQAHLLEPRQAVWWGCQGVRQACPELDALDAEALDVAELWVADPGEHYRRACEIAAQESEYSGPGSQLALAVFCSGGSLGPLGYEPIVPDERMCGAGVATALSIAAYQDPGQSGSCTQTFLDTAAQIAQGELPFPASSPAEDEDPEN